MLDKRFIRDHSDVVREAVRTKGVDLDVDELLALDRLSRTLQTRVDNAQATRRSLAQLFADADGDEVAQAELRAAGAAPVSGW